MNPTTSTPTAVPPPIKADLDKVEIWALGKVFTSSIAANFPAFVAQRVQTAVDENPSLSQDDLTTAVKTDLTELVWDMGQAEHINGFALDAVESIIDADIPDWIAQIRANAGSLTQKAVTDGEQKLETIVEDKLPGDDLDLHLGNGVGEPSVQP